MAAWCEEIFYKITENYIDFGYTTLETCFGKKFTSYVQRKKHLFKHYHDITNKHKRSPHQRQNRNSPWHGNDRVALT